MPKNLFSIITFLCFCASTYLVAGGCYSCCQFKTLIGHTGSVTSIAWNSENFIASGSNDGTVKFWNMNYSGMALATYECEGTIEQVEWSEDNKYLVCRTDNNFLKIFQINYLDTYKGDIPIEHDENILVKELTTIPNTYSFCWINNDTLALSNEDGRCIMWNCNTQNRVAFCWIKEAIKLFVSPCKKYLAGICEEGKIEILDLNQKPPQWSKKVSLQKNTKNIEFYDLSKGILHWIKDDTLMVAGFQNGEIVFFNPFSETNFITESYQASSSNLSVKEIKSTNNKKYIFVLCENNNIKMYENQSKPNKYSHKLKNSLPMTTFDFSKNNNNIAWGTEDGIIVIQRLDDVITLCKSNT